jgi:lysophospholipase L1-like esterase
VRAARGLGIVSIAFIGALVGAWLSDDFDLLTRTLGYASLVLWTATLAASALSWLEHRERPVERYAQERRYLARYAQERRRRYLARLTTLALALAGGAMALFLAALGAAVLPDNSAARPSPPLAIKWTVDAPLRVETQGSQLPTERPATVVFEVADPERPDCSGGRYTWTFDEEGSANDPRPITRSGVCDAVTRLDPGRPVDVRVTEPDEVGERTITVRRLLIVSFGDSVAAGEGNPSPRKPKWVGDPKCHRSTIAGPRQAAQAVADVQRHAVVTFLHLAGTGAWIDGVDAPPKWAKKRPSVLPQKLGKHPSQLWQFNHPLPAYDGEPIVLLSVGANDLGFAQILRRCTSPRLRNCFNQKFVGMPMRALIAARFAALESSFGRLAAEAPFTTSDVFVTEYFNPLRDDRGNLCHGLKALTLSRTEAKLAEKLILVRLNELLRRETDGKKANWHFVDGIAQAFRDHGYCAKNSWIVPLRSAIGRLNFKGTFHPNAEGQQEYGDRIFAKLKPYLPAD